MNKLSIIPEDITLEDHEIERLANELEEEIEDYLYNDSIDDVVELTAGFGSSVSYDNWWDRF